MKVSAEIETFRPATLLAYAKLCGWALARAHAKAGDAAMIAGYLGATDQFDGALAQYSESYADQAERDYGTFRAAIRSGRLSTDVEKEAGLEILVIGRPQSYCAAQTCPQALLNLRPFPHRRGWSSMNVSVI